MGEYYNKKLYSILGLLDQYNKSDKAILEYKYLLKYKFGINVESIHLAPQYSAESKNGFLKSQ